MFPRKTRATLRNLNLVPVLEFVVTLVTALVGLAVGLAWCALLG